MGVSLLGKIKLYELAKDLNLTSKELLKRAGELGIEVKSHLSNLEDEDAEKLRKSFLSKNVEVNTKKQEKINDKKATTQPTKNDKTTPVIIRREVIIEENKKKENGENEKKNNQRENKTPFVQRNQNKDYNIVYRNKPEKPLTVSELFGLDKEKKKKEETIEKKETLEKVEPKQNVTVENKEIDNKENTNNNIENPRKELNEEMRERRLSERGKAL